MAVKKKVKKKSVKPTVKKTKATKGKKLPSRRSKSGGSCKDVRR